MEETADGEGTTKQAQRDTAVHVTGFSSPQRNLAYSGVMGDVMAGKEWQSPLQVAYGFHDALFRVNFVAINHASLYFGFHRHDLPSHIASPARVSLNLRCIGL